MTRKKTILAGLLLSFTTALTHGNTSSAFDAFEFRDQAPNSSTRRMSTVGQSGCGVVPCALDRSSTSSSGDVEFASQFPGSDLGAQVMSAYAALPDLSYGRIVVSRKSDGSCYAVTTPMAFTTLGKGVLIELQPGVCITQASTTATLFTFNFCGPGNPKCGGGWPVSQTSYGTGILARGARISGPGKRGSSTTLSVGGNIGSEGMRFEDFEMDSFATCLKDAGGSFQATVKDVAIMNCGIEVSLSQSSEMWKFEGGKIGDNSVAMPTGCFSVTGATQVVMNGTSLDSCQLVVNGGFVTGTGMHIEAVARGGCDTTNSPISLIRGTLALFDPEIWQDCGSGSVPAQLIDTGYGTGNAEYLMILGGQVHNSNGRVTQMVRQRGGIFVYICGLQNNSAGYYPFSNGVVSRDGATGPTVVCPSTTGIQGSSTYSPFVFTGASIELSGASHFKLADQGQCTMVSGRCAAQRLNGKYTVAPLCFANWTGTGTLAGHIKISSTTTTVTPASNTASDTAEVNWACYGS